MMRYFRVKNFDRFQHYRDRNPPWIKLHVALLDDYAFGALPDAAKAHLLGIWILASKSDNRLPVDPAWIARRIGATERVDLEQFFVAGFLVLDGGESETDAVPWASRYVSAAMRAEVLATTGGKCAQCGCADDIEIDHIIPISKGGTGVRENLQPLCRKCNRAKRVRIGGGAAEQVAPHKRNPEERRDRGETETEPTPEEWFERVWAARPRRPNDSKADARKAFLASLKRGASPQAILDGIVRYAAFCAKGGVSEPRFIKQTATFVGPGEWWLSDYTPPEVPVAPPSSYDLLAQEAADVSAYIA